MYMQIKDLNKRRLQLRLCVCVCGGWVGVCASVCALIYCADTI